MFPISYSIAGDIPTNTTTSNNSIVSKVLITLVDFHDTELLLEFYNAGVDVFVQSRK
jgi:hypothetical protein